MNVSKAAPQPTAPKAKQNRKKTATPRAVINRTKTFGSFYSWIDGFNEGKSLPEQIRCGKRATARAILEDYIKAANKRKLRNDGYLETSPALLGNSIGQSARSVFNHLLFLQDASVGFITARIEGDEWHNCQLYVRQSLITYTALNKPLEVVMEATKGGVDNSDLEPKKPPNSQKQNSPEMT